MTNVPTKLKLVAGAASLAVIGVAITLVPRSASQSTGNANSIAAEVTPLLAGQGVVENPPVSVTVNGETVPAKPGTSKLTTPGGTATVQIAGNSATVTSQSAPASSNQSGSLNVSVNSSSNGNVQSHSSVVTNTGGSTNVYSSSHTTISGSGESVVNVQTTTSN